MAALGSVNLVDGVLAAAVDVANAKSGYYFNIVGQAGSGGTAVFGAYAFPAITTGVSQTGTRRFAISEVGVMYGDTDLTAPPAYADIDSASMGLIGN
jgi:hypothetical protein